MKTLDKTKLLKKKKVKKEEMLYGDKTHKERKDEKKNYKKNQLNE